MDKVYIVHSKCYDGDHIVAICKTPEKAKDICAKENNACEPAYITEHDLQ